MGSDNIHIDFEGINIKSFNIQFLRKIIKYLETNKFSYLKSQGYFDYKEYKILSIPLSAAIKRTIENKGGCISFSIPHGWADLRISYPDSLCLEFPGKLQESKYGQQLFFKIAKELYHILRPTLGWIIRHDDAATEASGCWNQFQKGKEKIQNCVNPVMFFSQEFVKRYPKVARLPAIMTERLQDGGIMIVHKPYGTEFINKIWRAHSDD